MVSSGLICVRWSTSSTEQDTIVAIRLRVSSEADYEYPLDCDYGGVTMIEKKEGNQMFDYQNPKLSIHKGFQEQVKLPVRTIFRRIALISEMIETKLLSRFKEDIYFIQEIESENLRKRPKWRAT